MVFLFKINAYYLKKKHYIMYLKKKNQQTTIFIYHIKISYIKHIIYFRLFNPFQFFTLKLSTNKVGIIIF